MNDDPYKDVPNEKFFFGWVFISFIDVIRSFSEYFDIDFFSTTYNKALELGYDRKFASKKLEEIRQRYLHTERRMLLLNTLQNNFCRQAFFLILQEKISQENLNIPHELLLKLSGYDTVLPNTYCKHIPDDIIIPEKNKEKWIDFELDLPNSLESTEDGFLTIYLKNNITYSGMSETLSEDNELSAAFIQNSRVDKMKDMIVEFEPKDLLLNPKTICLEDLKNLEKLPDEKMLFEYFLYDCNNNWIIHEANKLTRVSGTFIQENDLVWDFILDMTQNKEKIIKFEFWHGPYNGDDDTRDRICVGTRLQIKKTFLQNYLKINNKSLILIHQKKRQIVNISLHKEKIKILDSKTKQKEKFYSFS